MTESSGPDSPRLSARDDSLERRDAGRTSSPRGDASAESLVARVVAAMARSGDDAEQAYQDTLDAARERAAEVVDAARSRYDALDENSYLERWGMVQVLTDLRHPAAVPVLEDVLQRPIPPERSLDPAHGLSTVGEEVMIRTTAVEGLARLAREGDDTAKQLLLRQVRHDAFSVRRAAVQAVRDLDDAALLDAVRNELEGTDDERLLEFRRMDVQAVPQAQGGQFLKADFPPPPPEPPTT